MLPTTNEIRSAFRGIGGELATRQNRTMRAGKSSAAKEEVELRDILAPPTERLCEAKSPLTFNSRMTGQILTWPWPTMAGQDYESIFAGVFSSTSGGERLVAAR